MIAFTILGFIVYLWGCACIGYAMAEALDMKNRIAFVSECLGVEMDDVQVFVQYAIQKTGDAR
jgi:hypothetical protein